MLINMTIYEQETQDTVFMCVSDILGSWFIVYLYVLYCISIDHYLVFKSGFCFVFQNEYSEKVKNTPINYEDIISHFSYLVHLRLQYGIPPV